MRALLVFCALAGALLSGGMDGVCADPVSKAAFVTLGGLRQWVDVEGQDSRNPVLLVVHGGPGEAQGMQADKYKPWQKDFTIVQWDQRGAGHTFGLYGAKTPDVTLDRIAKDGIELAQYLCRTEGKRRIIVLGHSWGSTVAIHMVTQRPGLFAAYVGTGQVSSWKAQVDSQFDLLLAKARKEHDDAAVKMLEAVGRPNPADAHQYFAFTKGLGAAMAPSDQQWLKALRERGRALIAAGDKDVKDMADGMDFSAEHVLPDQMATDLPATATRIDTAFFVIQGEGDVVTPTKAAVEYFNSVRAPQKTLVLIPDAGHFAFMTHGTAFLDALTVKVRPAAITRGA